MPILSIQSHVVYGHVGNSAAVFPLQRLGFEVWPLHTVQFSNHVGYDDWAGDSFAPTRLVELVAALDRQGRLADCEAVLSGYLGDPGLIESVAEAVERIRRHNPRCLYLCDPVMGDRNGGLYVKPGIPEGMSERLLPAADVITPNAFELGHLAGQAVENLEQAVAAAHKLIGDRSGSGPRMVVATGLPLSGSPDRAAVLAVSAKEVCYVVTPWLTVSALLHGGGDALAALFLGRYLRSGALGPALSQAVSAVFALFRMSASSGATELPLVAAQDQLVEPSEQLPAEPWL